MKKKTMSLCKIRYKENGIERELKVWVEPKDEHILQSILELKLRKDILN